MRQYSLLFVLSFILVVSAKAQNKITLDEAINLSYQNNVDLQKQLAKIKNAETILDKSGRLPNPLFSYSREDLKSNSRTYNEWSATGSIPINFIWDRWSNIDAKENSLEAQKLFYENLKWISAYQVREYYYSLHNYSLLSQSLDSALIRLTILTESAHHRSTIGDISEYELQRILIEFNKFKTIASKIKIKKRKLQNNLKLLIGFDVTANINTISTTISKEFIYSENDLINIALKQRNDLKAYQLLIESENKFLSHNKQKLIPEIKLTAGYKKLIDDFEGSVFQLDFEIPLFNRNQSNIKQTEIKRSALEQEFSFLKANIITEISESFHNYNAHKMLHENIVDLQFENVFNISAYSYQQGEITLIEFIDGINAFINGLILTTELDINYHNSFFRLEKVVGISFTNFNNNLGAR